LTQKSQCCKLCNLGSNIIHAATQSITRCSTAIEEETITREKCVAFAMGHRQRLGVASAMSEFDPELLRMVLECV
jgi:ABC-type taurine transport system ATPase subunit